jgi:phosphoribosylamine--glycine ligase
VDWQWSSLASGTFVTDSEAAAMKALVIGGGAREHAIAHRLTQEGWAVTCAPGNGGIARSIPCLNLDPMVPSQVVAAAQKLEADLVIVGPEAPLIAGLGNALTAEGPAAFAPTAQAARIEGSKAFAKELMAEAGVPTARHQSFDRPEAALAYAGARDGRVVVKADGIAGGKGVIVCLSPEEAQAAIQRVMVDREFGAAGDRVILEEVLEGPEVSLMALCDGRRFQVLPLARDYKRVGDGDRGPNTGGMGALSPPSDLPESQAGALADQTIGPILAALEARGTPFRGLLYAGLMLTTEGPKVLEYNCRFGDPECQVVLGRIEGEVGRALLAAAQGDLTSARIRTGSSVSVGVVVCAPGYPSRPKLGAAIEGLDEVEAEPSARVFFAGVADHGAGPRTAGGRVLTVVSQGPDAEVARGAAYRALQKIRFEGMHYRRDIASRPQPVGR